MSHERLDPEKIRAGVAVCAAGLGRSVVSVRDHTNVDDLAAALEPYQLLADLTLQAGAFGYPRKEAPSEDEVIDVMLDFLRAVGEATPEDVQRLRMALTTPHK